MKEIIQQILVWWFMICIFPGAPLGLFICSIYEEYTDTDHWFGFMYWPVLLIILLVKGIIELFTLNDTSHYTGHGFDGMG